MAVKTGKRSGSRMSASLPALALGIAVILPGAAFAQQDDHHGRDNGEQHQHERPAPVPTQERAAPPPQVREQPHPQPPRPAPAPGAEHNWRAPGQQWNGQNRPMPGNPPANYAPDRGEAGYRGQQPLHGQPPYQGQPGYQGQRPGNDGYQNGRWQNDRGQNDRGPNDRGPNDRGGMRGPDWDHRGYNGQPQGGQWNHNWRQDNRYNWRDYRQTNRGEFHVGRYYAPYRGYNYNRLSVGFYLQPLFFGSSYWLSDPWAYRLPPAYGPYHWVRYYDDVILVNTYTGQVVDVIYDFFW